MATTTLVQVRTRASLRDGILTIGDHPENTHIYKLDEIPSKVLEALTAAGWPPSPRTRVTTNVSFLAEATPCTYPKIGSIVVRGLSSSGGKVSPSGWAWYVRHVDPNDKFLVELSTHAWVRVPQQGAHTFYELDELPWAPVKLEPASTELTAAAIDEAIVASGLAHDSCSLEHGIRGGSCSDSWEVESKVLFSTDGAPPHCFKLSIWRTTTGWVWEQLRETEAEGKRSGEVTSGKLLCIEDLHALLEEMGGIGSRSAPPLEEPPPSNAKELKQPPETSNLTAAAIKGVIVASGLEYDDSSYGWVVKGKVFFNTGGLAWQSKLFAWRTTTGWVWEQLRETEAEGKRSIEVTSGKLVCTEDLHALLEEMSGAPHAPTPSTNDERALMGCLRDLLRSKDTALVLRSLAAAARLEEQWALEMLEEHGLRLTDRG